MTSIKLLLLIGFYGLKSYGFNCMFSKYNATYNLNGINIGKDGDHLYHTGSDPAKPKYQYYFNLCNPVKELPPYSFCKNNNDSIHWDKGYCKEINTETGECKDELIPIDGVTYAYQVDPDDTLCVKLSKEDGGPPVWNLIDNEDPSSGVSISLKYGDYSPGCQTNSKNRELQLRFRCSTDSNYDLSTNTIVSETIETPCEYIMELNSIWGCPTECAIYNGKLCSNNGICSYDWKANKPKCFCYGNYNGIACEKV